MCEVWVYFISSQLSEINCCVDISFSSLTKWNTNLNNYTQEFAWGGGGHSWDCMAVHLMKSSTYITFKLPVALFPHFHTSDWSSWMMQWVSLIVSQLRTSSGSTLRATSLSHTLPLDMAFCESSNFGVLIKKILHCCSGWFSS